MSVVVVSLLFVVQSFSQGPRGRMSVADRVKNLKEQLTLDSLQCDSIQKIFEAADKERSGLFESRQGDRDAMRDAMMKLTSRTDTSVEALLTADQKKKYEDVIKARQNRRGGRPDGQQRGEGKQ
jgi:hypothetical protein